MPVDAETVIRRFKSRIEYKEKPHCKLLVEVMADPDRGTISAFCLEAFIEEDTFYRWVNTYPLFSSIYSYCKMVARELWEKEGREIKKLRLPMGTISYEFEHWKLIGWSRFGVSKNSRIKLHLNPDDSPEKHYSQLLKQASQGDFTAAEIKQLMEAVNVGLNTHQVFTLQSQIDDLKLDLATMQANSDAHNSSTNKGIA
jgi:hypothetical protein